MGYDVCWNCDIIATDVKGLTKTIKALIKKENRYAELCMIDDLEGATDGEENLEFDDYVARYDENEFEEFVNSIAPYVEGNIECRGDEYEEWGYDFKEKKAVYKEVTKFWNFDSYEQFMGEHKEILPKDIVKQLEQWNIARKI